MMKSFFQVLGVLLLVLLPSHAYALACVSNLLGGPGVWTNPATWTACGGGIPGAGDSVTVVAGDTVLITQTVAAGASPGSITTYNIDISGTLQFSPLTGNVELNAYSSIRVNSGGKIEMGTFGSPLSCSYTAGLYMRTAVVGLKYSIFLNQGTIEAVGCSTWHTSSGTVTRARIASCSPDCNAGVGRTVTLDRTVNWNASTGSSHEGLLFGIGGNETVSAAAGDDPEMVTTWTAPGGTQVGGITFTENHMVGDIVANVGRNAMIHSDSGVFHPRMYTSNNFDDPYFLQWLRIDEFGESTSTNYAAVNMSSTAYTLGTIDNVAVTNVEDGGPVTGFGIIAESWDSFEGNLVYDVRTSGRGFVFQSGIYDSTEHEFDDCMFFGSSRGNGDGAHVSNHYIKTPVSGFWSSHGTRCVYSVNSWADVTHGLCHGATTHGIYVSTSAGAVRGSRIVIAENEIRNNYSGDGIFLQNNLVWVAANDIDGITDSCLIYSGTSAIPYLLMSGNSYDRCNIDSSVDQAAVELTNYSGTVRMLNESFGQTTPNFRNNIMWWPPGSITPGSLFRGSCSYCDLATPTTPQQCGSTMTTDGIYVYTCSATPWAKVSYIRPDSSFLLFDKDQVEGSHIGWGDGGTVYQRQTGTIYTTSNIKMQLTPGKAHEYSWIKVGSAYANKNDTVAVDLYLRKDTAIATSGWRPRIALEGCGFYRSDNYDEMSDVIDTWELVSVNGTADWKCAVRIYVGVRNALDGANDYQPVWPPTIDVYADGLDVTITSP